MAKYIIHGMSRTPVYRAWCGMHSRCSNPNRDNFERYGGRGITVCERWRTFDNFYEDMGERPEGLTLERVDNDKGYSPDNCIWADRMQQQRNQRISRVNTSGVRGVSPHGKSGWRATINVRSKQINLGTYATIAEAAKARKAGEEKYWE